MKWFKFLIGLGLLPALAGICLTLPEMATYGWKGHFWESVWFWGLFSGLSLWITVYFVLPRPMWVYVFGHELTHALMVYLMAER